MPTTITDTKEISQILERRKNVTESGYYGPVQEISFTEHDDGTETLDIVIEYPDNGSDEFNLAVPLYWESDTVLARALSALDVPIGEMKKLLDRSVPVRRVDGSWEVDMDRLYNGDYLKGGQYVEK